MDRKKRNFSEKSLNNNTNFYFARGKNNFRQLLSKLKVEVM